jgi:hypothetical protein
MKKFSFTFLCLLSISISGFSQRQGFGIKAGVTSNYLAFSISDGDVKFQGHKTGFVFGLVNQIQVAKHFAIQPNVQVALKGAQVNDVDFQTWHIEVPVNFLITDNGFFFGAGPYISFGVDGKAKGENVQPDGEADIYSEGEEPPYLFRQVEGGVNVLMGYTLANGLTISANFSHGLHNLNKNDDGIKIHSKSFGFTITQLFGKK